MKRVFLVLTILCSNIFSSTDFTEEEKVALGNQAMHEIMQKIWKIQNVFGIIIK